MTREIFPGWLPLQVAKFYDFPLWLTGKGQSVAIISLGGKVHHGEMEAQFVQMRITPPEISLIDIDPDSITDEQNEAAAIETLLDLEVISTICPDSKVVVFRASGNGGLAAAINGAVDEGIPVISISWGKPESSSEHDIDTVERALERARERNITVCVSAGDAGSSATFSDEGRIGPADDGGTHVYYPASSPNVLACGGTQMGVENRVVKETVWNNGSADGGATGGGVSAVFERPSWQNGLKIPHAVTSSHGRIVPDVAGLAAVRDWEIYVSGRAMPVGGTSAVAPLWAGLIVLANQLRAQKGKPPIGFVNERLYELARTHDLFYDVVEGHNKVGRNYPGYKARRGFDACTGWGTPQAARIVRALAD